MATVIPDMGTRNPIVYLIKIISKRMQKEVNEETAIVWRQRLEVREKNLEAIYQSESNREKIRLAKEAWANLKEKKEAYDKSKDGVSIYDKMIKFLKAINISLKIQDTAQLSNVVLAPGIIAGKISAFIEEQKKEVKYITRVAKTQKKIIKEDLKFYGAGLDALIDEINKGDDDYRQEILSKLDPWAQEDPYIADAPYNQIMLRYRQRLGTHELAALKDQKASGKKAGWGLEEGIKLAVLGTAASALFSSQTASKNSAEAATNNIGPDTDTDAAVEAERLRKETEYLDQVALGMLSAEELAELETAAAGTTPGPVHNAFQHIS
jgi:hypothetical protein